MIDGLEIERWAFWSPEARAPQAWREYWSRPTAVALAAEPRADAIPAMQRRRMSALSKLALQVALEASNDKRPDFLVFCSQHGELVRTRELLGEIVAGVELSPAAFSQSVHNTSAGLYTIVAGSHAPASSLASGANTFAYGWLEAEGYLAENSRGSVLLVAYEDLLPAEYLPYSEQTQCRYALALLLKVGQSGGVVLQSVPAGASEPLPMAPLFIDWWLSQKNALQVSADGQGWEWTRRLASQ